MGYSRKNLIEARIEELIFAIDMIENQKNPKILLMNKIDDLMEIIKDE